MTEEEALREAIRLSETEMGGIRRSTRERRKSALFAFEQAHRIAPTHPAPPFFLGIAHVRAGEFAKARPLWARALALTPDGVRVKPEIAQRLALLDAYLAQVDRPTSPRP